MTRHLASLLASGLLLEACAHPAPAPYAGPRPEWPPPPAAPRARWAGDIPGERFRPAERSWLARAADSVLGIERDEQGALFTRPFGVTIDGDRLLVADPDAPAVLALVPARGRVERIACPDRPWTNPMALAVGPDRTLFVADAGAATVVRIGPGSGCTALGTGKLERPTGVAVAAGRVYVVDTPRHEVVVFSPEGPEIGRFGGRGEAPGKLNYPTAIAAWRDALLVVDALNFRVARYTLDGVFVTAFGEAGGAGGGFVRPKAVAAGGNDAIYVSDAQRDMVLVFAWDGVFQYAIGGDEPGPGQLAHPAGLAVDGDVLYVADSQNRRLQAYQILGGRP